MEKRVGTALILVEERESVHRLNEILSNHSHIIIGRQGLPRSDGFGLISLVLEGTPGQIGSLTGQLGRLSGIEVRAVLLKNRDNV